MAGNPLELVKRFGSETLLWVPGQESLLRKTTERGEVLEEIDHIMHFLLAEQQAFRIHISGKALDLDLLLNRRRVLFG